ncbi:L-lysine 6-monooxygenase [Verminephrobacter aporrectodeae subsp. tuberculatae]|uniref:SidA/IucD/PvdA family monooxygenase n=1 Tax=Verminephrobacter aporrectodeae TaxID=1110389 RepID=UPI002237273E|nr:SidA/IucD/PvdA family monooxygenase [Verminephrobacter aporrectodeae]MCW5255095.1 L-lysine 6-monooxygenase [Verminephrobacter aporrectodeae subsp. tuberculatae]
MSSPSQASIEFDAICIGFGPAGIALSCVFEDAREQAQPLARHAIRFFESAALTQWHPELLLAGTDINHHVFRDLVTPRNPRSRFSFAMYLKSQGRMFDFGLLGRPASRAEWSDYVGWVSRQVDAQVQFDTQVADIEPQVRAGRLDHLRVVTASGTAATTRHLVLSTGSAPRIPALYHDLLGPRVFHTSQFLTRLGAFGANLPRRWMVVGSGQSASESVLELLERRDDILIHSVHRSLGFRLTQLGQFPNQVFSPSHVDYFHGLAHDARRQFLDWSKSTNYAGIDPDESLKLFSLIYEDRLAGRDRLRMQPYRVIHRVAQEGSAYRVVTTDKFTGQEDAFEVDAIVLATGYQQYPAVPLLASLQPWLREDSDGGLLIDRDYQVAVQENCDARLFVNGLSERSHGISDSQSFSLMALRAERIALALDQAISRQARPTAGDAIAAPVNANTATA